MPHRVCLLTILLVLSGCSESVKTNTPPPVTVIEYPVSNLPLSNPVRVQLVLDLQQLASPEAIRVCSAGEREYSELTLILATVQKEEWRTAPWSADQKRQVSALQSRWQSLGGKSRSVAAACGAFTAKLGHWF